MSIVKIKILLEQPEFEALVKLSRLDLRAPDEQARYILRQELARRGLLIFPDPNQTGSQSDE
ncbi:MAG: hypothetical protein DDG60_00770 [Anaerolineae bacterium]|nr:MAG: hypothetical protein DDG60_00770 [Anaerolineae bacterium]